MKRHCERGTIEEAVPKVFSASFAIPLFAGEAICQLISRLLHGVYPDEGRARNDEFKKLLFGQPLRYARNDDK